MEGEVDAPLIVQAQATPLNREMPPLHAPTQQSTVLTQDQVRARAGQILIGFENADPQQLGRVSYGAFQHVLAVYGGIEEHQIKVKRNPDLKTSP